ncbi:hypothetical protein TNIN_288091 [Trichonephila inaurata madagascariensis]|uniref:Uncharacterized protein n=1 Tax=Trichonephila inaurata madagascariensis TaxID=2747483 RepID=A0A8X6Y9I0_9ARAC|nr:hypothetical protein TNIN_288091 [Trichonephila inaurata madagascariensis]
MKSIIEAGKREFCNNRILGHLMSFSLSKTKESCRTTSQQDDGRKEKVKGCFRSLSHPANKNLSGEKQNKTESEKCGKKLEHFRTRVSASRPCGCLVVRRNG